MTLTHTDAVLTWTEPSTVALRGTLVLFPGRGESPQVYERLGRRLAADAYRVHAVTAPSDSAELARGQLDTILQTASAEVPRVVIGSDAGAAYAAHLAAGSDLAGVAALILAGLPTSTSGAPAAEWDAELDVRTACSAHRGRIAADGVRPAALFEELPATWLDSGTPGRIAIPTLGIHGRDDAISPIGKARAWYSAVPQAELVTIAGGRHDALNDQTHRSVAATVVLFLERLRLSSALTPIATTEVLRRV